MALEEKSSLASMEQPERQQEDVPRIGDLAALLSCALNVTDTGDYQLLGDSTEKLLAIMGGVGKENDCDSSLSSCTIPSFQLHQQASTNHNHQYYPFQNKTKAVLQDAAAANLKVPLTLQGARRQHAPMTMLWNLQNSFLYLIRSRLKSTLQALGGQGRAGSCSVTNNVSLNPRSAIILQVLQPDAHPIQLSTIVTSLRTVSSDKQDQEQQQQEPLLLQVVVDFQVLGQQIVTCQVQAPGTISGVQSHNAPLSWQTVEVTVDTSALLRGFMQETRRLVRQAVSLATQIAACATQTLPRNAPGGFWMGGRRQQYLSNNPNNSGNDGGLLPAILSSQQQPEQEYTSTSSKPKDSNGSCSTNGPCKNNDSAPTTTATTDLHLFQPVNSTKALEECFSMPPPPARFPRPPSCSNTTIETRPPRASPFPNSASLHVWTKRKRPADVTAPPTNNVQTKVSRTDG